MGFLSNRRNKIIKEEIEKAYLLGREWHDTNIHWEAFVRFAQEHGGRTDKYADGGLDTAFNISLNIGLFDGVDEAFLALLYEEEKKAEARFRQKQQDGSIKEKPWHDIFKVIGVRNRIDGTTSIQVRKA